MENNSKTNRKQTKNTRLKRKHYSFNTNGESPNGGEDENLESFSEKLQHNQFSTSD